MENGTSTDSSNPQIQNLDSKAEDSYSDSLVESDEDSSDLDGDIHIDVTDSDKDDGSSSIKRKMVWRKDERPLQSDEELDLSPGCYDMLHRISLDWSCLSFDILKDDLGAVRFEYPLDFYVVSGTQPGVSKGMDSMVHVMKWSNLTKNFAEDEDDEEEEECSLRISSIKHKGIVNRIKSCPQTSRLVCSMSDTGDVHIWDIQNQLDNLNSDKVKEHQAQKKKPLMTCTLHESEGYAVNWSPTVTGKLATGSCDGSLVLWEPVEGGWKNSKVLKLSTSIEDLSWSHSDHNLLVLGCCDGTFKVFDTRDHKVAVEVRVSDSDVNSVSVNSLNKNHTLVGSEDGSLKIFDLSFPRNYISNLKWHKQAITSVDWHPLDSSVCAASSRDDSVSIWDVSIEADTLPDSDLPQQLLFLHMGQTEITEIMFHRNIPGVLVSTSLDGFNVFKTVNVD